MSRVVWKGDETWEGKWGLKHSGRFPSGTALGPPCRGPSSCHPRAGTLVAIAKTKWWGDLLPACSNEKKTLELPLQTHHHLHRPQTPQNMAKQRGARLVSAPLSVTSKANRYPARSNIQTLPRGAARHLARHRHGQVAQERQTTPGRLQKARRPRGAPQWRHHQEEAQGGAQHQGAQATGEEHGPRRGRHGPHVNQGGEE